MYGLDWSFILCCVFQSEERKINPQVSLYLLSQVSNTHAHSLATSYNVLLKVFLFFSSRGITLNTTWTDMVWTIRWGWYQQNESNDNSTYKRGICKVFISTTISHIQPHIKIVEHRSLSSSVYQNLS